MSYDNVYLEYEDSKIAHTTKHKTARGYAYI